MTDAKIVSESLASTKLEQRVVLYIDLLGFKDFVNKIEPDTSEERRVKDFHNALLRLYKSDGNLSQTGVHGVGLQSSFSFFSDSIIVSNPCGIDDRINKMMKMETNPPGLNTELSSLFNVANMIQMNCLTQLGLVARGALSMNLAYHNDKENSVFGLAVNRAVYLEEEIAIFPRVILDGNVVERCNTGLRRGSLKQDNDGAWFVNNMQFCFIMLEHEALLALRKTIIAGMDEHSDRVRQKWIWLAKQFNEESQATPRAKEKDVPQIDV